jgi:putative peptidoglycan lipid II flippase
MMDALRLHLNRWSQWGQQSVNRRIFVAALTVGSMTTLVKLVAIIKELVVANWYGTGDDIDAFLIAFLLATFSVTIIAESFNVALMPTYIQVREQQGLAAAKKLFANATLLALVLLLITTLLLGITASYTLRVLASGFDTEKQALTRSLYYVMLPVLVLRGLSAIWGALLNADEQFSVAAISPLTVPALTLIFLLFTDSVFGVYSLAIGTTVGFGLETLMLAIALRRQGFSLLPHWDGISPELRQVIGQYSPMVAGALVMSSTTLVDQAMAAALGSGSVASLAYGNRIVSVFLLIGSLALGTAVLPHFSRMLANQDRAGILHTFRAYAVLLLTVTIPFTLILVTLSPLMTRVLYERGAFTAKDTELVSKIQIFFLFQIPFYLLSILVVRLISAFRANHILLWGALINLAANIGLNVLFIHWFGVAGIALSTSGVYVISLAYVSYHLRKLLRKTHHAA